MSAFGDCSDVSECSFMTQSGHGRLTFLRGLVGLVDKRRLSDSYMAAVAPATQCSRTQCSRYTVRPAIQCGPHTVQPPTQCRPLYSAARYFREIEKSGAVHGA